MQQLNRQEELQTHRSYWFFRRLQDIVFSFIALIILLPISIIIALIIWIDDPHGSPFFKQERCGRDGKIFKMIKFRTMYNNAESELDSLFDKNEMDGPAFKIKDDPRITKVGKFLRKTSLDELPQFWNVLKGEMSIVGPRPALAREVEQYKEEWKQRMFVTPGITGYWQITPNRNSLSFENWMELDIKYIQERSFWVGWKIIFKTICTIFRFDGV